MRGATDNLRSDREQASKAVAEARADLAGIEREWKSLLREKEQRERQANNAGKARRAIDAIEAEPGFERAVAAALGREGTASLSTPEEAEEGRFWTGADIGSSGEASLLDHVRTCPPELRATLSRVRFAEEDDGRSLKPGERLVTRDGWVRRWDGYLVRGEGQADAARLEAANRLARLQTEVPTRRAAVEEAQEREGEAASALDTHRAEIIAAERRLAELHSEVRDAERAWEKLSDERERSQQRRVDFAERASTLTGQLEEAQAALDATQERMQSLPPADRSQAALNAAREANDAARNALQIHSATLAAHEQDIALAKERVASQTRDIAGWTARSGDAAKRLSDMTTRLEEIGEELAVVAAKPEGLRRQIEDGDAIQARLMTGLREAEAAVVSLQEAQSAIDTEVREKAEMLAQAREERAGLAARAENEDARRIEMARISGERFQCPPPLLPDRLGFDETALGTSSEQAERLDALKASRERIGPVNLVAADELKSLEEQFGANTQEQAELTEAVHRLRGSIGSLNREGRERLRTAFEEVDTHFRRLFTRLFEGGQAHLALIDSDDPLEAGLEIYAQPPGKRLQSLTLLSGGEQALTAVALIFALFLTNPAPICVLDEVDAPLDDANIDRFCDLLDTMNRETATRYLIVTHNAVTMSRMHRLFGVTMVEPGVSRLVSVDLGGAEELLAAE